MQITWTLSALIQILKIILSVFTFISATQSLMVTVVVVEAALGVIWAAVAVELAAMATVKVEASFCSPCCKEVTHHHQVGVLKVQR